MSALINTIILILSSSIITRLLILSFVVRPVISNLSLIISSCHVIAELLHAGIVSRVEKGKCGVYWIPAPPPPSLPPPSPPPSPSPSLPPPQES